uniref:Saposin B-type domain-containing protein n=1 Tax=Acrobeloides nanus TaxID=290746 RepID=A0A914DPY2_9BILA
MINAVNYYAQNNAITQSDLQTKLLSACGTFAVSQDQNSCKNIVNNNIAKVYNNNPIPVQNACQTCQLIMTNAVNYYTQNNAITQSDLQTKLLSDCGTFAVSQDQNSCKSIVNKDFSKVYNDLKGGRNYGQICDDLNLCIAA